VKSLVAALKSIDIAKVLEQATAAPMIAAPVAAPTTPSQAPAEEKKEEKREEEKEEKKEGISEEELAAGLESIFG